MSKFYQSPNHFYVVEWDGEIDGLVNSYLCFKIEEGDDRTVDQMTDDAIATLSYLPNIRVRNTTKFANAVVVNFD